MQRPVHVLLCVSAILLVALCSSCGGGASSQSPADNQQLSQADHPQKPMPDAGKNVMSYSDPEVDFTWDLMAGQNSHAGTVHVYNDADTLFVCYDLFDGWLMTEAQVLVSSTVPSPKGGAPGQFPYKEEFDPAVSEFCFEIPLDDFDAKQCIYIATHAATTSGETIWGGYWNNGSPSYDFNWSKKWGGGFETCVMPVFEPFPMQFRAAYPGANSYWGITFTNAYTPQWSPWPANVVPGWCTDPRYLDPNVLKNATIYSCYDPNLPAYAQSANWDLISFMLNERFCEPGSIFATASAATFQNAVWFFKYGLSTFTPPANDPSWALIENAQENGENFIPCACDDEDCHWFAGIIWPGTSTGGPGIGGNYPTDYQMLIFALDP